MHDSEKVGIPAMKHSKTAVVIASIDSVDFYKKNLFETAPARHESRKLRGKIKH